MSRHRLLPKLPKHLNVIDIRPVWWPAGGHVVSFTTTGALARSDVQEILNKCFCDDALIRRFCARRQTGEFSLFPDALSPTAGDTLAADDQHLLLEQGAGKSRASGQGVAGGRAADHTLTFAAKFQPNVIFI